MDHPTPLIRSVKTPLHGRVVIEASDGYRYSADLSMFSSVRCYPPNPEAWNCVSVDSYGLGLIWACRFEVHADQIVGLADNVERIENAA